MKRTILTFAAAAALALSACTAPAGSSAGTTGAPTSAAATTQAPGPGFDTPAAFGQSVTFPSGVESSVKVVSFGPPAKDVGVAGEGNQAVFILTISNKSGTRIDASQMSGPKVAYGANLESATSISNANITTLLDGETKSDQFSRFIPVSEGRKVRVQVPDPDGGKPAIFEGRLTGG